MIYVRLYYGGEIIEKFMGRQIAVYNNRVACFAILKFLFKAGFWGTGGWSYRMDLP